MDDATICPICQQINHCGIAAGKTECWCFTTPVPDAARQQVPEADQMRRCICEICARAAAAATSTVPSR
jgi:hypothetical protein